MNLACEFPSLLWTLRPSYEKINKILPKKKIEIELKKNLGFPIGFGILLLAADSGIVLEKKNKKNKGKNKKFLGKEEKKKKKSEKREREEPGRERSERSQEDRGSRGKKEKKKSQRSQRPIYDLLPSLLCLSPCLFSLVSSAFLLLLVPSHSLYLLISIFIMISGLFLPISPRVSGLGPSTGLLLVKINNVWIYINIYIYISIFMWGIWEKINSWLIFFNCI